VSQLGDENSHETNVALINDASSKSYNDQVANSAIVPVDEEHNKASSSISMKRFIVNLIPSSAFQPLKMPFPEEEHYLLSSDSCYYINDKDLNSIIAFSLSSKEYKEFQENSSKIDLNTQFKNISASKGLSNNNNDGDDEIKEVNKSDSNTSIHFELRK